MIEHVIKSFEDWTIDVKFVPRFVVNREYGPNIVGAATDVQYTFKYEYYSYNQTNYNMWGLPKHGMKHLFDQLKKVAADIYDTWKYQLTTAENHYSYLVMPQWEQVLIYAHIRMNADMFDFGVLSPKQYENFYVSILNVLT